MSMHVLNFQVTCAGMPACSLRCLKGNQNSRFASSETSVRFPHVPLMHENILPRTNHYFTQLGNGQPPVNNWAIQLTSDMWVVPHLFFAHSCKSSAWRFFSDLGRTTRTGGHCKRSARRRTSVKQTVFPPLTIADETNAAPFAPIVIRLVYLNLPLCLGSINCSKN